MPRATTSRTREQTLHLLMACRSRKPTPFRPHDGMFKGSLVTRNMYSPESTDHDRDTREAMGPVEDRARQTGNSPRNDTEQINQGSDSADQAHTGCSECRSYHGTVMANEPCQLSVGAAQREFGILHVGRATDLKFTLREPAYLAVLDLESRVALFGASDGDIPTPMRRVGVD